MRHPFCRISATFQAMICNAAVFINALPAWIMQRATLAEEQHAASLPHCSMIEAE
jgi:hypothetical protein